MILLKRKKMGRKQVLARLLMDLHTGNVFKKPPRYKKDMPKASKTYELTAELIVMGVKKPKIKISCGCLSTLILPIEFWESLLATLPAFVAECNKELNRKE